VQGVVFENDGPDGPQGRALCCRQPSRAFREAVSYPVFLAGGQGSDDVLHDFQAVLRVVLLGGRQGGDGDRAGEGDGDLEDLDHEPGVGGRSV
jgi:hypothetical protein